MYRVANELATMTFRGSIKIQAIYARITQSIKAELNSGFHGFDSRVPEPGFYFA
jgi:hypothetical protein